MRYRRSSNFFIHRCAIERPTMGVVSGTIRDTKITEWATVASNVDSWFEPQGASAVDDGLMGRVPVDRYTVWMPGNTDVRVNDRLLKGSDRYIVDGVHIYTDEGWHVRADVRKENYAQA